MLENEIMRFISVSREIYRDFQTSIHTAFPIPPILFRI